MCEEWSFGTYRPWHSIQKGPQKSFGQELCVVKIDFLSMSSAAKRKSQAHSEISIQVISRETSLITQN